MSQKLSHEQVMTTQVNTYKSWEIASYPNYELRSEDGENFEIWHKRRKSFLTFNKVSNGYLRVSMTSEDGIKKTHAFHRVILSTVAPIEGLEKLEVNHINGVKTDNRLSNLEWMSRKDNVRHAHLTGLHSKSNFEVLNLVHVHGRKRSGTRIELADLCGLTSTQVSSIANGSPKAGWAIDGTRRIASRLCQVTMRNKVTGQIFNGTPSEFQKAFSLPSNVVYWARVNASRSCKGWQLLEDSYPGGKPVDCL